MSTKVDRIDAAKRRVLAARTFVFDPRRLVFVNAARAVIPIEDVGYVIAARSQPVVQRVPNE